MIGCNSPPWALDDFSLCFQKTYLQTIFPAIACCLSLSVLLAQTIRYLAANRTVGYQRVLNLSHDNSIYPSYRDNPDDQDDGFSVESSDSEFHEVAIRPTRNSLQRSHSNTESVLEVDQPKGKVLIVVVETVLVAAVLASHVVTFIKQERDRYGWTPGIVGVLVWSYILALALLRLFLSSSKRHLFSKLWSHTTVLYCWQWIIVALLFRSALIHPASKLVVVLAIVDFSLVTTLCLIAGTARRGNKAVILEYEGDLEPGRESLASLFSVLTFSWVDPIVWKGYKKTLELADVWNLEPKDKAAFVLAEYRQVKKAHKLALHLLLYFKAPLIMQGLWAFVSSVATFAPTLLIKAILEYVENPSETPPNAAWFYVILLALAGSLESLSTGQSLWIGRKVCIHLRSIVIGEIYAKVLRRKAAASADTILGAKSEKAKLGRVSFLQRIKRLFKKDADANKGGQAATESDKDSQVNTGTVINLMAVDSFKIGEISAYLHFIWATVPVQLVIAVTLLYRLLGYSSLGGMAMMLALFPVNIFIASQFSKIQAKIMAATDKRIHTTNEVLQNIRIIKYFAWEARYGEIVNEKRAVELKQLRNRYILWACAATIWYGAPVFITFLSFFIYTVIEHRPLIPSVAFTALSLFSLLRLPFDQFADMLAHVQESRVSIDRVEEFLGEDETEKYSQIQPKTSIDGQDIRLGFSNATFSWGSKDTQAGDDEQQFRLMDINVQFLLDQLNIIVGPTGSGKTSLLMALLGEMTLIEGSVFLPGGRSREDLRPDPETGLIDSVAYCAQQAWLVNGTIKENIIFASPWDPKRYSEVLIACSLQRDLKTFDNGDETLVGEKGIALSGGQKQRVSLARALYCNSRHVLLDDCLSAVDSQTAKWIFDYCILGPLMYNRTCVLVTHNVALCVPRSQYVVALENGRVVVDGSPEKVIESGVLGDDINKSHPGSKGGSRIPSRVPSNIGEDQENHAESNGKVSEMNGKSDSVVADIVQEITQANTQTETKAEGGIRWSVVQMYLVAMGRWYYWAAAAVIFAMQQLGNVSTNVWIRQWANAYHYQQSTVNGTMQHAQTITSLRPHNLEYSKSCHMGSFCSWDFVVLKNSAPNFITFSRDSAHVNALYYLGVYSLLGLVYLMISLFREGLLFAGSLSASRSIHQRLLAAVSRANFGFFDTTPLGQIMNRFSKDLESVDQEVAPVAIGTLHCLASVLTIVILISVITPDFLLAGVFISAMFFFIGQFYIRSSRDLKRLESVQRSPLYQQFGETLTGVTTIRAYGDEKRFIRDNLNRVNTHNRPFIYLWATNRWLAFRVDNTGALVSFFAAAFIIMNVGKVDAGAAGLSLSYAVTFTENVLWLVRLYAVNEQNMNSVERIKEYIDVKQEAAAILPDARPPANWPSQGAVQFINYTTRYRKSLDPVLRNVSFVINAREKVGIVGRTGAGKSSLALALFRGLEAEEGKIVVDGVDVGLIGLQDLRESITIVPQDPTLFTGTIRSNLDPFSLFTDEAIFTALRRVQLIGSATATPPRIEEPEQSTSSSASTNGDTQPANRNVFLNLSSPVAESGNNLSQGQRQLLCLARAMLKSPKVLLMDEATASIDYSTDAKIQGVIRELEGTIITIAHRLQTIIDYDKVLVLDKGELKEFDHPWKLIQKEDGIFRAMCETSGDMDLLLDGAKKAWDANTLVDTA